MSMSRFLCQTVVWLTVIGIAVPQISYGVEGPGRPSAAAGSPVRDVALSAQGCLQGKVVDSSGKPVAQSPILLKQNGKLAAQAATDAGGKFAVAGLRPGLYEVATQRASGAYRVWSANSAPPSAIDGVLIVDNDDIIRAQGRGLGHVMLVTGLIVTAGIIGGVIGYNIKDDDDAS